jgi:hypothetical protein
MTDMKPITFTRKDEGGNDRTRLAYTPADVVKLRFDGWTEQPAGGSTSSTKSSGTAEKTAK